MFIKYMLKGHFGLNFLGGLKHTAKHNKDIYNTHQVKFWFPTDKIVE